MSARVSSRQVIWTVGAAASIALILWLDRVTPNEYSFEIFYVIPILVATVAAGRNAGMLVAIVAGFGWTVDTIQEDGFLVSATAWNIATRAAIFIGVVVLIDLYNKRGRTLVTLDRHREDSLALVAHKLRETASRITSV